jgi:hypothetical protein
MMGDHEKEGSVETIKLFRGLIDADDPGRSGGRISRPTRRRLHFN